MKKDLVIVRPLLSWYSTHGRKLPWRHTRDPYRIWISEVMLQQTQVDRVKDYYRKFLLRFSSVTALAQATWPQVLSVWRGLGYYHRAKNLQKTAKHIVREYRGCFPKDRDELLRLPGIGKYSASAIQSFAYGEPVPALDTNIKRVLQRVLGCPSSMVEHRAHALYKSAHKSAATLNHAFMDLGAALCRAQKVECPKCPLKPHCHFARSGQSQSVVKKRTTQSSTSRRQIIDVGVACIHRDGKYLIGKRPASRGGSWEFPGGKREKGEDIRACLKREIREEIGVEVSVRPSFLVHAFQDGEVLWRLHFCRCQILRGKPKKTEHTALKWLSAEKLKTHPFPPANRKAVDKLCRISR